MAEDRNAETERREAPGGVEMDEDEVDSNVEGTFPASDPPSWTLGTNHGRKTPADEESKAFGLRGCRAGLGAGDVQTGEVRGRVGLGAPAARGV